MATLHPSHSAGFSFGRAPLVAALVCAGLLGAAPVYAATINVTASAPDVLNGANGSCSLREAITNINNGATTFADCANVGAAYGSGDTINIPAGAYVNSIATTNENLNANGDLDILKNVAIVGAGASNVLLDGGGIDRVFHLVTSGKIVAISGVTIQNGNGSTIGGGGIWNASTLTLTDALIRNNKASGVGSGGILSQGGGTTLINSTVSGNTSADGVGGIDNYNNSPLTITNSTISGNTSSTGIGGIHIFNNVIGVLPVVNITNSTLSGNTGGMGGILVSVGTVNLTNATISANAGDGTNAGGIQKSSSAATTITLRNSIVAGNTGPACVGTIVNGGNNIDDGTSCGWSNVSGSMSGTNPLLGPLALNAPGSTRMHALLAGSPAINGVTFGSPNGAPATDQRGVARPVGAGYDIGAFEAPVGAVNQPPVAVNDSYATPFKTTLTVAAKGVLTNDSDPDSNTFTALYVPNSGPAHGTLSLDFDGGFTYTPTPGYSGPDSFTYYAYDGTVNSATPATVIITVGAAANLSPVAQNDSYATPFNTPLTVAAPGLLGNDNDPDSNPMTAQWSSNPSHGTLTSLNANGGFVYTPMPGYSGSDSFTYHVNDGTANSSATTVSITVGASVNNPPLAANDNYATPFNTALNVAAAGVLANDSDPDGNPLGAMLATGPSHGTLTQTLNANGSFIYTPAFGYSGPDSFTYYANDGTLNSAATATVSITVGGATIASIPTLSQWAMLLLSLLLALLAVLGIKKSKG